MLSATDTPISLTVEELHLANHLLTRACDVAEMTDLMPETIIISILVRLLEPHERARIHEAIDTLENQIVRERSINS